MSNSVFVLNDDKTPLMPCKPARARLLLKQGRAAVFRTHPFTIILKEQIENPVLETIRVKVDPGSKTTGIALTVHYKRGVKCIWGANLEHRGHAIKDALLSRAQCRRGRRGRKLRHRKPRFLNRFKPEGWLAPSIMSRVDNTLTWVNRLMRYCPVGQASVELVKFDMQKMENPEVTGKGYQQGTLHNYEVKEYLLYRYNHTCQYCKGVSKDHILEIEHIVPKSKGGTNSIGNLTLACSSCNRHKNNHTLKDWLEINRGLKTPLAKARVRNIPSVISRRKPTLRDAAAVNATRHRLVEELGFLGLPTESEGGHVTKYNRRRQGYPKDHWIDAALVGDTGSNVHIPKSTHPLLIKKTKVNNRQMTRPDKYGFPRTKPKGPSKAFGFKTGDVAKHGRLIGRVAIRTCGYFNFLGKGCSYRHLKRIQSVDGYQYTDGKLTSLITETDYLPWFTYVHSVTKIDGSAKKITGKLNKEGKRFLCTPKNTSGTS